MDSNVIPLRYRKNSELTLEKKWKTLTMERNARKQWLAMLIDFPQYQDLIKIISWLNFINYVYF